MFGLTTCHVASSNRNRKLRTLRDGIPTNPLPGFQDRESRGEVPHAPRRGYKPTLKEKKLALKNALRYVLHHVRPPCSCLA